MAIEEKQYLDPDGLKEVINQTDARYATKDLATTSASGLMSSSDKTKLNNIESGANKTVIDSALSSTSTNPVQNKLINAVLIEIDSAIDEITENVSNLDTNKVDKVSGKGLSTEDYTTAEKEKLAGIEEGANKTVVDSAWSATSENPLQNKVIYGMFDQLVSEFGDEISKLQEADANKANTSDLTAHTTDSTIHFTAAERTKLAGVATGANKYTHPTSGVTAGTYKSVTVDANGHVTAGTNPTTLAGYGITDAEAKGTVNTHNSSTSAHSDIRLLISDLTTQVTNFLDVDDTTKDQLSEVIALIEANADSIESITSGKVNVSDIINNLTTNVSNKPLSAAQGVVIKELIDDLQSAITNSVADWNQNDETASSYVKNRPFYETDPVLTELMAEQTLEFTIDEEKGSGFNLTIEGFFDLVEGEIYVVTFDEVEYECVCINEHDILMIGNLSNLTIPDGYEDTGEPFLYAIMNGEWVWFSFDTKTSHTVSVSNYQKPVVKIDSKFLPDSAFTDAVWENVSNKPFESTEVNAVIQGVDTVNILGGCSYSSVINTTVDFKFGYYYNIQGTITLIPNEKYEIRETLTVDGLFQASNKNMLKLGTITTSSSHATTIIELYGKNANYYPGFVGFNGDQLGSWDIEVDLTVLEEVLKLDEKYLPESTASKEYVSKYVDETITTTLTENQSDWSQNDGTQANYIKNRTHWVEKGDRVEILSETTVTVSAQGSSGNMAYKVISSDLFTEGKTYYVIFDGTEYECVSTENGVGADINEYGAWYGTSDPPFVIDNNGSVFAKVGDHTISIYSFEEIVHKLDEKYIPESVASKDFVGEYVNGNISFALAETQSDWNQNDETDPAYIKGRTHWTEKTEVELLAEETYEVSDSEISLATVPYLIAGDTYFVTWNGTKYECVAQEGRWSDIPCVTLGNVDENDEGEPFVLFVNPEFMARSLLFTVICKVLDGSSTVTMSISHLKEVVHTIDPKYIEDMYYTSVEEVVGEILPETELTSATLPEPLGLVVGKEYTVKYNGTEYVCTTQEITDSSGTGVALGNIGKALGDAYGTDTGEPFLIVEGSEELVEDNGYAVIIQPLDDPDSVTISIACPKIIETVHPINPKYLGILRGQEAIEIVLSDDGETGTVNVPFATAYAMDVAELQSAIRIYAGGNNSDYYSVVMVQKQYYLQAVEGITFGFQKYTDYGTFEFEIWTWTATGLSKSDDFGDYNFTMVPSATSSAVESDMILQSSGSKWQAVFPTEITMLSSTEGSTKKFKVTVDDDGSLTVTNSKTSETVTTASNNFVTSITADGSILTITKGDGTSTTVDIQPSKVNVTFSASEWSESNSLYTQTVTVSNISADDEPELVTNKSTSMSTDDIKAYNEAFNYLCEGAGETGDGTVTWVCLNKPEIDITVGLKM